MTKKVTYAKMKKCRKFSYTHALLAIAYYLTKAYTKRAIGPGEKSLITKAKLLAAHNETDFAFSHRQKDNAEVI